MFDTFGVLMGLVFIAYVAYIFLKPSAETRLQKEPGTRPVTDVYAAVAGSESLKEFITLNGVTRFLKQGTIRSQATGYVSGMNYSINRYIRRGALFCTIRTKEQDVLRGMRDLDSSMKNLQKPLPVISNAAGLLTAVNVHNGDYVSEGEILAEVKEPSSLVLVVNVPFEYTKQIRSGSPCEVQFADGRKMNLSISGVLPTVESTSQTQAYYINMPDQSLPENLNVTLKLSIRQSHNNSLTIPISALQTDELEREFWVMKILGGVAYRTLVVPGVQSGEQVEIKGGDLSAGDSIVTEGSYGLEDSSLILIQTP